MADVLIGTTAVPTANRDVLRSVLAGVVLSVPGVVRLEPTLSTAGARALLHSNPADGLHVLVRAGTVDVDVNIATSTTHQARAVARQVQTSITAALVAEGCHAGAIVVSVLTINP